MKMIPILPDVADFIASAQRLRIGGVRQSGYRRERGGDAVALCSQTKSVWLA